VGNKIVEEALVTYDQDRAGTLRKLESGFEFQYDPGYLSLPKARPISFSLPLQKEPHVSPHLFSFFDGLLPEGWLLELTPSSLKIDKNDKFQLLVRTSKDPLGAVSIEPLNKRSTPP